MKSVTRKLSELNKGVKHRGTLIWFTGLSGSGKSSIANEVKNILFENGCKTYLIDGDIFRRGISSDLGFSVEDRNENIRRAGEVTKMFVDAGIITLASFISPFKSHREKVRNLFTHQEFIEVYCRCPLVECERRDTKGLYKKARSAEIRNFTAISSPYEEPLNPDLLLDTNSQTLEESVNKVIALLEKKKIFSKVKLLG